MHLVKLLPSRNRGKAGPRDCLSTGGPLAVGRERLVAIGTLFRVGLVTPTPLYWTGPASDGCFCVIARSSDAIIGPCNDINGELVRRRSLVEIRSTPPIYMVHEIVCARIYMLRNRAAGCGGLNLLFQGVSPSEQGAEAIQALISIQTRLGVVYTEP